MLRRTALARLAGLWLCTQLFTSSALAEPRSRVRPPPEPSQANSAANILPANSQDYQRLMSLGIEEFDAGRWAEARALFLRGHALSPSARSFRALGMTAFNLKDYPDALRELSLALEDARRPLPRELRAQTRELLDLVDSFVGRYRVQLEPTSAELRVDGLATKLELDGSLLLAVGKHVLEVEAPEHALLSRPIVVDGTDGESLRFQLRPLTARSLVAGPLPSSVLDASLLGPLATSPTEHASADPGSQPRSLWSRVFVDYRFSWLAGASALALGGASAGLYARAQEEARELEERCDGKCTPGDGATDQRDRLSHWSTGLMVGSLVLLVGTAVLIVVERRRVPDRTSDPSERRSWASQP